MKNRATELQVSIEPVWIITWPFGLSEGEGHQGQLHQNDGRSGSRSWWGDI